MTRGCAPCDGHGKGARRLQGPGGWLRNGACPSRRGFTLVEAIVTMVILAIVMGMASRLFYTASVGYTAAATRAELHTEISMALERIVTEVREARRKVGASPAVADITAVGSNSMSWYGPDGALRTVMLTGTTITYSIAGGAGVVLASSVSAFGISTFDEAAVALSGTLSSGQAESVRRVQITITGSTGGVSETLRTRVFPRACMGTGS